MPKVVPDQRSRFENDDFFRKHSRESEIKYVAFRDRPIEERQLRFQSDCREGQADIAFTCTGTIFQLSFKLAQWNAYLVKTTDFDKEPGKVHFKASFILNGVCVICRGWMDLQRLDGTGCLEFDEERAKIEDAILREQMEQYNKRLRDFEERQRQVREERERQEAECEARRKFAETSPRPCTSSAFHDSSPRPCGSTSFHDSSPRPCGSSAFHESSSRPCASTAP